MNAYVLHSQLPDMLLPWYRKNARNLPWRRDQIPYHIWLSEIMLQQTRVETVKVYYEHFLQEIPTIEILAAANEEKLFKLWEGLGYYKRIRHMQKAAQVIVQEYEGKFPREYQQILELPGIGTYTAGAIASICFEQPTPAVDGNVLRVMARIMQLSDDIRSALVKKGITEALAGIYPQQQRGMFTQALMELGATVCTPQGRPKCWQCPVLSLCEAYLHNRVAEYPLLKKKKERTKQYRTVFVFFCDQWVAVRKRPSKGLLADMWEFPNVEGLLMAEQALELAAAGGLKPLKMLKTVDRIHIFTHMEWHMKCYHLLCQTPIKPYHWIMPASLKTDYALPTAFKKCW